MTAPRAREVTIGTLVSVVVHVFLLIALGAWLRAAGGAVIRPPLSVTLVTDVEPYEEKPHEERTSAATVPEEEPAPAALSAEPPAEIETPELPPVIDAGARPAPDPPAHLGSLKTAPGGPVASERESQLASRRRASGASSAERTARIEGRAGPRAVVGLERSADTLIVPSAASTVAEDVGVVGPLGKREILYRETPSYPIWAREEGLEAELRFRIWVAPSGRVGRVEVIERSGSTELDRLAIDALRRWRFRPLPRGVPQRDEWGELPMAFRLVTPGG